MGNLDFAHNAGFSWYCLLLMFSGIAMLVTSVLRYQTLQRRVLRAILGVGFFCYGFYLTFVFSGGHYALSSRPLSCRCCCLSTRSAPRRRGAGCASRPSRRSLPEAAAAWQASRGRTGEAT
jgi:hypothetical protein